MQENQSSLYQSFAVDGFLPQHRYDKYSALQTQHPHCCLCPTAWAAVRIPMRLALVQQAARG